MFSRKQLLSMVFGLISALLLGQVCSAISRRPAETAVARLYTGGEPLRLTGTVLVETEEIDLPPGDWTPHLLSGQRAFAGQTVFSAKKPDGYAQAAQMVRVLRLAQTAAQKPVVSRREALRSAIRALNGSEGANRTALAEKLLGNLLGEQPDLTEAQAGAEARLLDLSGKTVTMAPVTAPASGIVLLCADGSARLVTGDVWRLQVELPFWPDGGETLEAELLSGIFDTVAFTVETVAKGETGCLATLLCREHLAQAACMDNMTIKILQKFESGLEIPAKSVYTVEDETGVWCQVGDQIVWKPVTVLFLEETQAVVALDRSSTGFLWPGDVVLLEGKEGE